MRSLKHWSLKGKVALGLWTLAGFLLLIIAAENMITHSPVTRTAYSNSSAQIISPVPSPVATKALPPAPFQGRRVKPVALALSDDSGKRKCSKAGDWWVASGDEGLFWSKTQCETFERRDDGFGVCPAFSHYHAYHPTWQEVENGTEEVEAQQRQGVRIAFDGLCHDDNTDAPVEGTDRKKLPKPTFHPDPNSVWL